MARGSLRELRCRSRSHVRDNREAVVCHENVSEAKHDTVQQGVDIGLVGPARMKLPERVAHREVKEARVQCNVAKSAVKDTNMVDVWNGREVAREGFQLLSWDLSNEVDVHFLVQFVFRIFADSGNVRGGGLAEVDCWNAWKWLPRCLDSEMQCHPCLTQLPHFNDRTQHFHSDFVENQNPPSPLVVFRAAEHVKHDAALLRPKVMHLGHSQ
mmetsp:Transcript_33311/g.102880  ORF Transcript_33311/g.102880 Transcript_33311/m.102880 type:complete len:212 (-) Transcript_33311:16-651(-)